MNVAKWRIVEFLVKLEITREEKYSDSMKDPERMKQLQEIVLYVQEQIIEETL